MATFFTIFLIVLTAEIGDKTQLLTIAFASKYNPAHVFAGIFIATLANHGFAVLVGRLISTIIPLNTIRITAAASFILFGLWTLKSDRKPRNESPLLKFGTIFAVAAAFFTAELGDKTQLAAVSFAATNNPVLVLSASLPAMMTANTLSIIIGNVLGRRIPLHIFTFFSVGIFILFGAVMLLNAVSKA